ncbi:DDE-domain-containing protein [Choiromyces venosus 120613-1]|uniref:DDE-domain-containing protein n=1 Tax=Choiromyces venosus 120613-1 TaxID=1336337 RepID=A0A3N4JWE4_9PEZI|nr:DDE-domain-containing protein [Choiromyces venosus 120613-1]
MAPIRTARKRRGPKAKPISKRILTERHTNSIIRPECTYSRRQKVRVLVFLEHHRIPQKRAGYFRKPTQKEAGEIYKIPQRTISVWVSQKDLIEGVGINAQASTQESSTASRCWWPGLEQRLYDDFIESRQQGRIVRRGWFLVQAGFRFRELYPTVNPEVFQFSNGWFQGFLGRHRISLWCITKKAQKVPTEYQSLVINWLRFNRRNSQPRPASFFDMVLSHAVGRFEESNICNLDETPIPFEYLEGKTYNTIGQKTIWAKAGQNGWDKRQASLVLCIFADGIPWVPPMIIFRGKGERLGRERSDYHPGVEVEFNEKAYMNDSLFLRYIEEQLVPVLGGRPTLFAIDLMGSHKTPAVLEKLRANNITPSLIPARCTSLIQLLDVSVNKPFKEIMWELTDNVIFEVESLETFWKWSVSHRRILTTSCVGDAYYRFHIEKGDIIQRVFRKVGLSLPIDGSCDLELDIKGFSGIQIGNWREDQGCVNEISTISDIHDNDESIEFVDSTELL